MDGLTMANWFVSRMRSEQSGEAPLTAVVRHLDPFLRDHLHDIGIRFRGATAEISLRFSLFLHEDQTPQEPPLSVSVTNPGESRRWPTLIREIPLDVPIESQLEDLEASGLVGTLWNTRNKHGNDFVGFFPKRTWGPPAARSWRLLTHAGTTTEYSDWRRRLQTRMRSRSNKSETVSIT